MKKKRRKLPSTNQDDKGDPPEPPRFELVRPPEENNFVLEVVQSKSFKQHNAVKEITYRAKLKNPSEDVPLNLLLQQLHALFDTILVEAKEEYGESGVMRIYISHPNLEKAIIIPPTHMGYLNSENILEYIDTVLYSAGKIPADEALEINAAVVHLIEGAARKPLINLNKDIKSKRSFIKIKNNDYNCLPRAIVVGYWYMLAQEQKDKETAIHYKRIRDSRLRIQGIEANMLRQAVGVPVNRLGRLEDVPL